MKIDNNRKKFKIACAQMNSSGILEDNLLKIQNLTLQAKKQNCDLVAFPENMFVMEGGGMHENFTEENHIGIKSCQNLAKENNIFLLIGSAKIIAKQNKRYNRSILLDNQGEIIARYDKLHLFDVKLTNGEKYQESKNILAGEKAVLTKTNWGTAGLCMCYDMRFPNLFRFLANKGADFIFLPSAFTAHTGKMHWHVLLRARAIETGCYIIAPAQCGSHPAERKTYGHALIVNPLGKIIAEANGEDEQIITTEIDLAKVKEARMAIPSLTIEKDFLL